MAEPSSQHTVTSSQSPQTESQPTLDPDELAAYISQYPFAAEPTYFTRPNRYYGPASTWRSWTEHERTIAESLDYADAIDLSKHLYTAFALRKHNFLDRNWTAWPVPLLHQIIMSGSGPVLEDALTATTLRIAREQWAGRDIEAAKEKRDWKAERAATREQLKIEDENEDSESGTSEQEDFAVPEGTQVFSSQAFQQESSDEEEEEVVDTPLFLADDERAAELLAPCNRHVLSKLDDLLMGLHRARSAYGPRSRSRSRSRASSVVRSGSRADARRELRSGSSKSRSRSREKRPMGLRDWSDVLGMAAMVGWDESVLDRAGKRCAELFGEDMLFRRVDGGSVEEVTASGRRVAAGVTENKAVEEAVLDSMASLPAMSHEVGPELVCPVASCPKARAGYEYSRAARLYEHISRKHLDYDLEAFIEQRLRNKGTFGQYRGRATSRSRPESREGLE